MDARRSRPPRRSRRPARAISIWPGGLERGRRAARGRRADASSMPAATRWRRCKPHMLCWKASHRHQSCRLEREPMTAIPDFAQDRVCRRPGCRTDRRRPALAHARRHRGEAGLRAGRRRRARLPRHLSRASRPICAAPTRPCMSTSPGRSGNMPASPRRRIPTPSTGATSRPGRRACRSPSISPPTAATTPTIRASPAMSAWRASRSIRSTTCARCSPASRSTR